LRRSAVGAALAAILQHVEGGAAVFQPLLPRGAVDREAAVRLRERLDTPFAVPIGELVAGRDRESRRTRVLEPRIELEPRAITRLRRGERARGDAAVHGERRAPARAVASYLKTALREHRAVQSQIAGAGDLRRRDLDRPVRDEPEIVVRLRLARIGRIREVADDDDPLRR